jgi:hypothetical protein
LFDLGYNKLTCNTYIINNPDIEFDTEFYKMIDTWKSNEDDLVTESMNMIIPKK